MLSESKIWVGTGETPVYLLPGMANRHGLIAGATGTGKTVSLKVLAEGFSAMGVPVFMADVKGDLSGMVVGGEYSENIAARLQQCGVSSFQTRSFPTIFWDVYGEKGHPVRTTVSEMGPFLLSHLLDLNDTQSGVMNLLFRVADKEGMLLLDIKDLKAMLAYVGEHAREYTLEYGNVSQASIGAIQRKVAVLEDQGGDEFFGEPALNISDWMQQDEDGLGAINILAADRLYNNPTMYSTFMLWMLSELYETLPEIGDQEKPRMIFFFDEAHLLFNNAGKALLEKVEQVVRLVRSKGVGIYFISQSPADIPMNILGQLGNRIQHAMRAYTPMDQKAVKVAAQTFRTNPAFDTEEAICQLKTGEALVSFLDEDGAPGIVQKATILPPQSSISGISDDLRKQMIELSPLNGVYEGRIDNYSAYEMLAGKFDRNVSEPKQTTAEIPTMAQPQAPKGFKVFNQSTGTYEVRQTPTLTVPETAPSPKTTEMPVMIYDQVTGQYIQKMMPMQLDPSTGNYVPMTVPQAPAAPVIDEKAAAEEEKRRKAEAKAEKERKAEERRKRSDELREEAAQRARKNDSVLGRMANTAINTVSRELTKQVTRGIMGGISGIFGGTSKKK